MSAPKSLLQLAAWSRFKGLQKWSARHLISAETPFAIPDDAVRVLVGGDINFDPSIRQMWNLGLHRVRSSSGERTFSEKLGRKLWNRIVLPMLSPDYHSSSQQYPFDELSMEQPDNGLYRVADNFADGTRRAEVDWNIASTDWDFPFRKIASFLQSRDVVVMNLETPLTDTPRAQGLFKSDPNYAAAMKRAGITALNLSNNHIFDAGEQGFYDTTTYLERAGIQCLGIGNTLEEARLGALIETRGTQLRFLGYTQFCNSRFASLATTTPGVLPLDRKMMVKDIERAKETSDLVIVSLHWGLENQPNVHPAQVDLAHILIDAGADCIVGHHPHVPHAIEVYRGRPVIYSLGNFIFAQRNHPSWTQNLVCELIVSDNQLIGLVCYPINSRGGALFQPELMSGADNFGALNRLQIRSLPFETGIGVKDGAGYISLQPARKGATVN
jgi:poly-gamma-glutamate capsule biosynthesis protein CapA/YwtB (metallophosphatase superfamily)